MPIDESVKLAFFFITFLVSYIRGNKKKHILCIYVRGEKNHKIS